MTNTTKLLSGAAALALLAGPASAIELTYGSFQQPTSVTVAGAVTPYFERVTERTNGEITFKTFWAGSMGGPKELLGAVETGALDAALQIDVYAKRALPHSASLSSLIGLVDEPRAFAGAMNETQLIDYPKSLEDFADYNQIPLGWYSTTSYLLQCTSEVATLEQLQGKKVRSVSRLADMMCSMGAVPVSVTVAEMYEAMQRGQVDCALASTYYLNSYNIKDFVTHVVDVPLGAYIGTLPMSVNLDVWEDLEPEQRKIMLEEVPEMLADAMYEGMADDESAEADLKAKGGVVMHPDDAFMEALATFRAAEWDQVTTQAGEDGVDDPEALIATFRENLEKWRGIVAEVGDDREAYAEALRREIYSKLDW